jgi:hypothetical protein
MVSRKLLPILGALAGMGSTVFVMALVATVSPDFVSEVMQGKVEVSTGDASRGQELFIERQCIACHSVNGVGGAYGPDLSRIDLRSSGNLAAAMWNHAPVMEMVIEEMGIPWPVFRREDIADLTAFFRNRELQQEFRGSFMTPLRGDTREEEGEEGPVVHIGRAVERKNLTGDTEGESEKGGELPQTPVRTQILVTSGGVGFAIPMEVEIREGNGNLFLNIENAFYYTTLQQSVTRAYVAAMRATGVSLGRKDVFIRIGDPFKSRVVTIEGESAGAAVAVALVAAIEGRELRPNVLITGTVNERGVIGSVGGIYRKAEAARKAGATTLLVPPGEAALVEGLEVVEVHDLREAEERMLT